MKQSSRNVTLGEIARFAGVSVSTVSRALSGHPAINPETREQIKQIAFEHAYNAPVRRSRKAANQDVDTLRSITIVMYPVGPGASKPFDPFSLSLIGGIGAALRERNMEVRISPKTPSNLGSLTELIETSASDGYIFLSQGFLHDAFNALARSGCPLIVWGAQTEGQAYCSVGSDNFRGGHKATAHLARLGRKRIAFLGDDGSFELRQRHEGYFTALKEAGLPASAELQRRCAIDADSALDAVIGMIDSNLEFDGIVAASDLMALGALRALSTRGIDCPKDVAVVGYDDLDLAAHTHPSLTTIRQDTMKAGRMLVTKLTGLIQGQKASSERLPTDLIVRESCGA